jgi:flagellar basal-body rod protein FlgF
VRDTGEPLDFAIVGDGWFGVQTPQGTRYTRNGQFSADAAGHAHRRLGNRVLGRNGQPDPRRRDGTSTRAARRLRARQPAQGATTYVTGAAAGQAAGTVRTGALEGSNADPARSMVDMIASFRAFESGQRVIQTIDETLQKTATQVATATSSSRRSRSREGRRPTSSRSAPTAPCAPVRAERSAASSS